MSFSTWLLFLSVSLAAAFSPGPGVLMAISTASSQGARRAFYSSAGNALGVFIVATTAVTGLGLLLKASELAFGLLKLAGAAYLVYLGIKAWRGAGQQTAQAASRPVEESRFSTFRAGLLVAISNPKAILFFTAVFPQFMPHDHIDPLRFMLLTTTFTACTLLSHFFYVSCAAWLKRNVATSARRRRLAGRSTAVVFIGMGGALLTVR
ncbi:MULTISPECIES: LysE family translocator [unclassified Duganella]|jgi:homoserine/homoserine lactone efflux protein|uniref:LysE family translocator n=1 Tax=unclassified Duganella TaxID=2636909 RepID=UPI00088E4F9B|nr:MULTISPECIES: LysE family translocator [unclassified Duganella]SDF70751.1 Threonine/homoserine/homoserine lactone efflux protein [Duganella sp. OV458]SDI58573.1 Threonine/homoserine/homoserine lactone efflux protein [Duganella sp. OV510]